MKSSCSRLCNLSFIRQMFPYFTLWLSSFFRSKHELAAEIVALRSQLALYQLQQEKGIPKPRCTPTFRLTWILLKQFFAGWQNALCIVKPETVIRWHQAGFRLFWKYKSRHRNGRPAVSKEIRKLIKKITADNPLWSPERIYDQLVDLGFTDIPCPNTIRKYLPKPTRDKSKSSQAWKTFIKNHMDVTWSMDFFVVPTLTFRLLYVFIVLNHERREVVHFGVTQHPTMLWVMQQLREGTGFGVYPKYIIRDNDSIYGSGVPTFLKNSRIKEVRTAFQSPWQNPYVERVIETLRRELLDHVIP